MAQSWQRLREGKTFYSHDVMLIEHEARESAYMKQGLTYKEVHEKVCEEGMITRKNATNGRRAETNDVVRVDQAYRDRSGIRLLSRVAFR